MLGGMDHRSSTRSPQGHIRTRPRDRWLIAGLLLLCVVPSLAGVFRLFMLAGVVQHEADSARLLAVPLPLSLHIVSSCSFLAVGAFQLAPTFRAAHPRFHRTAGVMLVPVGLCAALTGLWLTLGLPPGPHDGPVLFWIRMAVGATMTAAVLCSVVALRRRQFSAHGAWMLRAYALGMGAGTQVLTYSAMWLSGAEETTGSRALAMGAGWAINVLVAEWVIRRRDSTRRGARSRPQRSARRVDDAPSESAESASDQSHASIV
jgi:hypothetical protein